MDLETYTAPEVSANVPSNFEVEVSDHHEFTYIQHLLKNTVGLNYKFEEVGCDGKYHAVFWMGDKPIDLIRETKKTFNNDRL